MTSRDQPPDFVRNLIDLVVLRVPTLSRSQIVEALQAAKVTGPQSSIAVADYLSACPAALRELTSDPPWPMIRLGHALRELGAEVVLPGCASCGRQTPALNRRGSQGERICGQCYQPPTRVCRKCGRVGAIQARANTEHPDLCGGCYQGPQRTCSVCGRERPCPRFSDETPVCGACLSQRTPPQQCSLCGQVQKVHAVWPVGPVCVSCYARVGVTPRCCPGCGRTRLLIARDEHGAEICGSCAGTTRDYLCSTCGRPGFNYSGRRCAHCVLTDRVDVLLAGPHGAVPERLMPLRDTLIGSTEPRTTLHWLRTSTNAAVLAQIAGEDLTHALLDEYNNDLSNVHRLRSLLVHAGVLPPRDEHLSRTDLWLNRVLAEQPNHLQRIIRPFAQWEVLRRYRDRPPEKWLTPSTAGSVRHNISIALQFLLWLDEHELSLDQLTQDRLDAWLISGSKCRYLLRNFVRWTARRGLSADLHVAPRQRSDPAIWLDQDEHWDALRNCLTNPELPLDVRAGGGLLLLFGTPATRLVTLTNDHITTRDNQVHLRLGRHDLLLPSALATIVLHQAQGSGRSTFVNASRWLFPGDHPGQPLLSGSLNRKLREHGISPRAGRNTGLAALAADLPPAVLADLLGLHITTAVRWSSYVRRDWNEFLTACTDAQLETNT